MSWISTPNPMIPNVRWSVLTRHPPSCWRRPGLAAPAGLPLRQDYEYRREGTRKPVSWPASPWRVGERWRSRSGGCKTSPARWLADEAYPEAEVVRVVLDKNTHRRASLYETFPAEEARRIARRGHGSWLNMAEFSVLSRRLSGEEALRREYALVTERNAARATINVAVQHPGRTNQTSPPLPFRFYG